MTTQERYATNHEGYRDRARARAKAHRANMDRGTFLADQKARSHTLSGRFSRARANAGRRRAKWDASSKHAPLPWVLTLDEWSAVAVSPCVYCGRRPNGTETGSWCDRKDNDPGIGYTPGNVVPCCGFCNMLRGNRLTHDEMRILGPGLRQIREAQEARILK